MDAASAEGTTGQEFYGNQVLLEIFLMSYKYTLMLHLCCIIMGRSQDYGGMEKL